VNVPSKLTRTAAWLALTAVAAGGCVSHTHTVGLGATGADAKVARQFYLFFGLVQVNEVDTQRMAPDLTSYTVDTRFGFVDVLFAPLLLPLTMTSRTVTVRT
jgi:hypothetical protein